MHYTVAWKFRESMQRRDATLRGFSLLPSSDLPWTTVRDAGKSATSDCYTPAISRQPPPIMIVRRNVRSHSVPKSRLRLRLMTGIRPVCTTIGPTWSPQTDLQVKRRRRSADSRRGRSCDSDITGERRAAYRSASSSVAPRHLPCASRASDLVTPPASACSITKFSAWSCGSA